MYIRGISLPKEYEDEIIFSGLLLDVTEQRLAEKAIRTANKQLENIIEFLPDATCIIDERKAHYRLEPCLGRDDRCPEKGCYRERSLLLQAPFYKPSQSLRNPEKMMKRLQREHLGNKGCGLGRDFPFNDTK